MTKEEAINGLKENLCFLCAYGSQNMDRCGIRECDNRDYIKALEQQRDDCVSLAEVFEIMGNLLSIPYDFDRQITEKDVSESMDKIKALPPVTPTHGTCKDCKHWCKYDGLDTCKLTLRARSKDFYCADFEKRGDKNEICN